MSDPQSHIDTGELRKALAQNVIHYDPHRVDYTINDSELSQLETAGDSIWKDVCLATAGLAVPALINGIAAYAKPEGGARLWTSEVFFNCLFGLVALIVAIICGIVWRRQFNCVKNIIQSIKSKPKFRLPEG